MHFVVLVGRLIAFIPSLIETYKFQWTCENFWDFVVTVIVVIIVICVHPYSYIVTLDLPITISHHTESSIQN
jgi:hypothetical protein